VWVVRNGLIDQNAAGGRIDWMLPKASHPSKSEDDDEKSSSRSIAIVQRFVGYDTQVFRCLT
jgi:hypothetical protein